MVCCAMHNIITFKFIAQQENEQKVNKILLVSASVWKQPSFKWLPENFPNIKT